MKKARVLGIAFLLVVILAAGLLVPGCIALRQEENALNTTWQHANNTVNYNNLSK